MKKTTTRNNDFYFQERNKNFNQVSIIPEVKASSIKYFFFETKWQLCMHDGPDYCCIIKLSDTSNKCGFFQYFTRKQQAVIDNSTLRLKCKIKLLIFARTRWIKQKYCNHVCATVFIHRQKPGIHKTDVVHQPPYSFFANPFFPPRPFCLLSFFSTSFCRERVRSLLSFLGCHRARAEDPLLLYNFSHVPQSFKVSSVLFNPLVCHYIFSRPLFLLNFSDVSRSSSPKTVDFQPCDVFHASPGHSNLQIATSYAFDA